jgi:glutathione peroxidase-family protein
MELRGKEVCNKLRKLLITSPQKFLVGKDGQVVQRYGSTTTPETIAADVEKALAA